MRTESIRDSKRLAPGQVWMSFRFNGRATVSHTTLLIGLKDDNFTWLVLRTTDKGRMFTHTPALHFLGNELDEDDEEVTFVRVA